MAEQDINTGTVQEQLTEFSKLGPEQRPSRLQAVTRSVLELEGLALDNLVNQGKRPLLSVDLVGAAFQAAVETPFIVGEEEVRPWQDGGSVGIVDIASQPVGLHAEPSPGFEGFGDLRRFGVVKAIHLRFLELSQRWGGLQEPENFKYLMSLGLRPGVELYSGTPTRRTQISRRPYWIGASGCVPRPEYMRGLLSFFAEEEPEGTYTFPADIQSSVFDSGFSEVLSQRLSDPDAPIQPMEEPVCLQRLRYGK